MDGHHFDALSRALSQSRRRRSLLSGALAMAAGWLGVSHVEAKKKRKNKKRKSPPTVPISPPPPPPSLQLAYACSGSEGSTAFVGDSRLAQTFEASRTGSLRQIQFGINKATATTGDYVLHLLRVNAGTPGNSVVDVLAVAIIPDAAVPVGDSTLTGTFSGPQLVQGSVYAAAVTRPGSAQQTLGVQIRQADDTCSGEGFFANGGPFNPALIIEFIVSVLVE